MLSKILILEDSEERIVAFKRVLVGHNIVVCKAVATAIGELYDNTFDFIFLDCDLGDGKRTGTEVAQYLSENPHDEKVVIHSMNPIGQGRMKLLLPDAEIIPFDIFIKALKEPRGFRWAQNMTGNGLN